MFATDRIAAITINMAKGTSNSNEFVAGEVADLLTIRVMSHPSMTPERVSDLWDDIYNTASMTLEGIGR